MRRYTFFLVLISAFLLAASTMAVIPGGSLLADGLGINECPEGKVLFAEQPILKTDGYENLTAAVLIKGESLNSETYLHKRSDGWTHLSSEKSTVEPLAVVSNCLPKGAYRVRIEYYTRVPMVGDWLLGAGEYRIVLKNAVLPEDTQKIAMFYRRASLKDNLILSWPLFAVYAFTLLAFIFALIIFLRHVSKFLRHITNKPPINKGGAA